MLLWTTFYILAITASTTLSANILGIFPIHVKSHYVMFERLLKRLAEKGHNVDVVTQFPSDDAPSNYNQFSLKGTVPSLINNLPLNVVNGMNPHEMTHFMATVGGLDVCKSVLKTQVLIDLKKSQKKYDLVMNEIFGSDCMMGFGYFFNAPTISLTSSVSLPWENDRIGNPDNPSYIPNYFVSFTSKMSLSERIANTVVLLWTKFYHRQMSIRESDLLSKEFFGPYIPNLEDLIRNTSLIFVNSHFSVSYPRPAVPNFIEVGGLHIQEPKQLSQRFQNILKTDNKGVIYLTMGSMILTETFDYEKLQGMFNAFGQLPYKVLWKASRAKFPKGLKIPENIHFEEWLPQIDILCHPSIKLFVSHGGLLGTQEAIYCGVPQLGIPLFADQVYNIRCSERLGLAIKVDYEDISKETILVAARKLLEDSNYRHNAEKASQLFKDRPMSPLDTAVYWVEYVIRHRGAPHLRSVGADLEWYQYFLLDVALISICVFSIIIYLVIMVLKIIIRFVCGLRKQKYD